MKPGEATKTPVKVGENYYVVAVTRREDANMDDFAKQRSSLSEQTLARKRNEVFGDYLASVRQKFETNGDIKIYNDAIAKLDQSDLQLGEEQ